MTQLRRPVVLFVAVMGCSAAPPTQTAPATVPCHATAPLLHRLNQVEFDNSMSSVFGMDVETSLPEDGQLHGFDYIAQALTVSPLLVERYAEAAIQTVEAALANPEQAFDVLVWEAESLGMDHGAAAGDVDLSGGQWWAVWEDVPIKLNLDVDSGDYELSMRAVYWYGAAYGMSGTDHHTVQS